jgi:hypothetical protein
MAAGWNELDESIDKGSYTPHLVIDIGAKDIDLSNQLGKIASLQLRARVVARRLRDRSFIHSNPFSDDGSDSVAISSSAAEEIQSFDGEFGRLLTDFSQSDKIVLTRILETTAMLGMKVLDVLEETIEINKDGGKITAEKRENPWKKSIFGIVRGATVSTGSAGANFDNYRNEATNKRVDGNLTDEHIDKVHNTTILAAVRKFREMMEQTLNAKLKSFGLDN